MVNARIENTETGEVQEFEGLGVVFAVSQFDTRGLNCNVGAVGRFSGFMLKDVKKSINKVIKRALKGEGRVE